jgi:L-malate glycosyltransferase
VTSPRRRVAVVAASLDIVGGQGVQARSLVEALERDGYSVAFVPIDVRLPRGFRWMRRVRGLRTLVNQIQYVPSLRRIAWADVAHVFSASYWSFLLAPAPAMIAGRLFGARVVLHYHSGEAEDHLSRWGALVHPWLRLADDIVVPSEYLRGVFARHGYATRVIPNIVDATAFRYRERVPLRPRVLCARNLERYYRVDLVIDAFARFQSLVPEATLTIAGYGSEEPRLRVLARSMGSAVRFAGKVAPDAMPALYDDHDIFLNASELDNQPVSILEAFAAGLPVISTGAGDIPAMVRDGETGLLVDSLDAAALARALASVWRDPQAARQRARRAEHELTRYSWAHVRSLWADTYQGKQATQNAQRPTDSEGSASSACHVTLPVKETSVDQIAIAQSR